MIELGKIQELEIVRIKEFGVYLAESREDEQAVLLPAKQVPEGAGVGDKLSVFIYRDSSDRLIATTAKPRLQVGETELLEVKDVSRIGAFLDMGLEKDLLLPFKEQTHPVRKGERCLVTLYVDKTGRLAATMHVYSHMRSDSPYQAGDWVEGTVYEIKDGLGAFVAVDNRYFGLVHAREIFGRLREGDRIRARVMQVRPDGKLDLSLREKAYLQMEPDSQKILQVMEEFDGVLPFTDKADPQVILREFGMSKNAFKRAVGHLLREGQVRITESAIERTEPAGRFGAKDRTDRKGDSRFAKKDKRGN